MKFVSVGKKSPPVSFREALFSGIAPDGGLYVPEYLPALPRSFSDHLRDYSLQQFAREVLSSFIGEIPATDLDQIIGKALSFPIPLVKLEDDLFLLELFHGPTLAFKDVGARFMAETMSYFLAQSHRKVTILVATSGDTGSAVAHGFHNVPNTEVLILYPSGRISRLQEQQMTTLGGNIRAIEVQGTFDDCQRLVKQALTDPEILRVRTLSTANSINLGRLLPQIVYYVWAVAQWQQHHSQEQTAPIFAVPSGNFGNLTAGVYAKLMGTPIAGFIAATNVNDVVPRYLQSGTYTPRPSIQTISNAMDVGNPSNLARLQFLFNDDVARFRRDIEAISISEDDTINEIRRTYERTGYILDPHSAVGVAAARTILHSKQYDKAGTSGGQMRHNTIVAATAHPAKFPDVVKRAIGIDIPLPSTLVDALSKPKLSVRIPSDYNRWKELLDNR